MMSFLSILSCTWLDLCCTKGALLFYLPRMWL